MLHIEKPTAENLKKTIEGLKEIQENHTPFDIHRSENMIEAMGNGFIGYLDKLKQNEGKVQPPGRVPSTTFLLFDDEKFVGLFDLRHSLTTELEKRGGHIAYQIIPSARGKGYCQKGLKLVLEWAYQNLGLDKALITCHGDNIPSHKAMLKVMAELGGKEREDTTIDGHKEHGVWIKTHIQKGRDE